MDLPTGTVTFLFTDIEGSTNLARELGPRWPEVLEQHNTILRTAIRESDGIDVRTEGDSFFAVFRSPAEAVRAAARAQRDLTLADWPGDRDIRVRMGMHTGEGRLAGDDYIGLDVHRAARIAAAAHGGQVLLSEATHALVANAPLEVLSVGDLGRHRLKDFDEPQRLYQLQVEGLPAEFPPLKTLHVPTNLPVHLTTFVGREQQVAAVMDVLGQSRLVTLTGPGGSGKTRLALEAARLLVDEFPDGVYFADLSAMRDPRLVPSAIVLALGIKQPPDRSALDTVASHLRDRQSLVLLDNYEQVVEAASVVPAILETAAATKALVTSRIRLDVVGEQEFPVPPMTLPSPLVGVEETLENEAVRLFAQRARSVRPSFDVTEDNSNTVAEICARLDGLPLAIELAAVQMRLSSPAEVLERLEQRLSGLGVGSKNIPERQRTLRRTIEWSYELLDAAEQRLFARLAVFAGGGRLKAIDQVCNPGADLGVDTLVGLGSLIDKSLVGHAEFSDGSRFSMLQTIREYAHERLETDFDLDETERRHAEFFAADAEERGFKVRGAWGLERMEALTRDLENFRAAISWSLAHGRSDLGLRIGAALWRFFVETGHLLEGRAALEAALALPSATHRDRIRAEAILALGSVLYWQADYEASRERYEEARGLYREIGDEPGQIEALVDLAYVALARKDTDSAIDLINEAREAARRISDLSALGETAGLLGFVLGQNKEYDRALAALNESLEAFEAAGDAYRVNETRARIGTIYRLAGRLDEAERQLRESLKRYGPAVGLVASGVLAIQLAAVASARGDHARALRLAGFAEAVSERMGGAPPLFLMVDPDVKGVAYEELDEATVDRIWEEGKAMDVTQGVAYALEENH